MQQIFISYCHEDLHFARTVDDELKQAGFVNSIGTREARAALSASKAAGAR